MSEKFSLLRAKVDEHKNMRGIMDKSLKFWKNDMKIAKIGNPCCCQREADWEEPRKPEETIEQLPFYEPVKKNTNIFKTVKNENQQTSVNNTHLVIKSETFSSSETREKKKYNDWNTEEDNLLIRLCNSHYYKKWKKIAMIIGNGKTPRMCAYRIKKLEKAKDMNLNKLKNNQILTNKIKEQDKFFKDTTSVKTEKSSSLLEFKKRKKMKKLINFRVPISTKENYEKKLFILNENEEKRDYNKTILDFKNLKIEEFLEPISNESRNSARRDHDMKSNNSSNDRSKIHVQLFNFSRKNSPEEELNFNNKVDFQTAYDKVFGYKKGKLSESDLNKNFFMEDETEMGTKECHTERISHSFTNGNQEKNEVFLKQESYNKFNCFDLNSVDQILNNSKDDFESKNIKLAKFLIEINNLTKNADHEEIKALMQIQAKILESMISLTKNSQLHSG